MLVGRPPFQGMSQYLIFEQIREGNVSFPDGVDEDGADLVRKLLVQNPKDRLGGGDAESENDLRALKNHQFLNALDIDNILNTQVPFSDWPVRENKNDNDEEDDELEVRLLNMQNEEIKTEENKQPKILVCGIIKKKCGWFYKKRYLVVSNEPRVYYTDTNSTQNIREIAVSKDLRAEVKAGNDFIVNNPVRSYFFREIIGNPQRWVDAINEVVKSHFK